MKKLLLLLITLLTVTVGTAQKVKAPAKKTTTKTVLNPTNIYLNKSDIVVSKDTIILKKRKYRVDDGAGNKVGIEFALYISLVDYKSLESMTPNQMGDIDSFNKLNSMFMNANLIPKYKLKNKLTYRPISISIFKIDGEWNAATKFTAQNSYGVTSELTAYISFDENGDSIFDKTFIR